MEQIIINMIAQAEREESWELISQIKELISHFAMTMNCPSNWRSIGETLTQSYDEDSWVYEELELWNYKD